MFVDGNSLEQHPPSMNSENVYKTLKTIKQQQNLPYAQNSVFRTKGKICAYVPRQSDDDTTGSACNKKLKGGTKRKTPAKQTL